MTNQVKIARNGHVKIGSPPITLVKIADIVSSQRTSAGSVPDSLSELQLRQLLTLTELVTKYRTHPVSKGDDAVARIEVAEAIGRNPNVLFTIAFNTSRTCLALPTKAPLFTKECL